MRSSDIIKILKELEAGLSKLEATKKPKAKKVVKKETKKED